MAFTVIGNEEPKYDVMHLVSDGIYWTVGFEDPFKLVLKVEAGNHADAGKDVGLIQTLLHSDRVAQYGHANDAGGVVTFRFQTAKAPPCLDAHPATRPFYDKNCAAKTLPASGSVRLEMRDDPFPNFPVSLKHHGGNQKKIISRLHMKESFLISLVEFDPHHKPGTEDSAAWNQAVKAQWEWGYEYVLEPVDPRNGHTPKRVSSQVHKITEIQARSVHLVADGHPAEEGAKFVSNPSGWEANH